jgi:pyruvate dehydrogenase E1 component alpha subunit
MAEMYGKANGCSKGRGGSMHLFCVERHFYGGHAIVGGGLPIAAGLALADAMQGKDRVTACFFGDGATDEGEFHEALNLASLWNLPVLFLCENNRYAMGTALERHEADVEITHKPEAHGIEAEAVDGMDVLAVARAVSYAAAQIREQKKPRFLELRTYRFRAHSMFDAELYRDKAEVEHEKERDPIRLFGDRLRAEGMLDDETLETIEREVAAEVEAAVKEAEEGPWEPIEEIATDVLVKEVP